MATGEQSGTIRIGDVSISTAVSKTDDGCQTHTPASLAAGKSGTLSTRTDDDTGVATLESGHGITTDDTVDVYWSGGLRYGMSVTAVDGDDVTIDLGAGDVLPAQSTALVVTPRVEVDIDFDGDDLAMIAVGADKRCHIEFLTGADASVLAWEIPANGYKSWIADQGVTNPMTGDTVGKAQITCGETSAATAFKLGVLYDSVA